MKIASFPLCGKLEPLVWENRFFNINSAILQLNDLAPEVDSFALAQYERIQVKIPANRSDWLDALQQKGFQLVESEADFILSSELTYDHRPHFTVAVAEDIPVLREQAAAIFTQSRFRSPWYKPGDSGRFYAQWIENAVNGTFDNQCLLLKEGEITHGFVTLRQLNAKEARIGLLAGHGAGERLMAIARFWCQQRGLQTLYVATQISNIPALRRYIQSGAAISSTALWLYR